MSAVLCLPACLCLSTAASQGQAPHGNASVGAVLEQVQDNGSHVPVAFWSQILAEGQR